MTNEEIQAHEDMAAVKKQISEATKKRKLNSKRENSHEYGLFISRGDKKPDVGQKEARRDWGWRGGTIKGYKGVSYPGGAPVRYICVVCRVNEQVKGKRCGVC